jgi:PAS domain S-box-containing protein
LRYRRLFEAAKDGLLILDPTTRRITDANPFIVKLLGYSRAQLIHKELWQIGLIKDEASNRETFRELLAKGFVRYDNLPLQSKAGRRIAVEFVGNLYAEGGTNVVQCNIRDITARRRSEVALLASEERFRALFDLVPVGVYCCDATGRILAFNRRAAQMWGRVPDLGDPRERYCGAVRLYLPDGDWLPHKRCPMAQVLSGQLSAASNIEAVIERPDGSRITGAVNIVPLKTKHGKIIGAINCMVDITERKQTEDALHSARAQLAQHARRLEGLVANRTAELTATNLRLEGSIDSIRKGAAKRRTLLRNSQIVQGKLRRLTRQFITAQEEERKQISRELHDEVVQTLVGINVALSAFAREAFPNPHPQRRKIAAIQTLVGKSVGAVHRFARGLRPAVLDDLGLIPALHASCRRSAAGKQLKIQITAFNGVEALDSARKTALFRVAQAALTNVVRHARATAVKVVISKEAAAIRMEISDNGRSFQVERALLAENPKRLGLIGMKERIEMIGGKLAIESVPGTGTTVRAVVPLLAAGA